MSVPRYAAHLPIIQPREASVCTLCSSASKGQAAKPQSGGSTTRRGVARTATPPELRATLRSHAIEPTPPPPETRGSGTSATDATEATGALQDRSTALSSTWASGASTTMRSDWTLTGGTERIAADSNATLTPPGTTGDVDARWADDSPALRETHSVAAAAAEQRAQAAVAHAASGAANGAAAAPAPAHAGVLADDDLAGAAPQSQGSSAIMASLNQDGPGIATAVRAGAVACLHGL